MISDASAVVAVFRVALAPRSIQGHNVVPTSWANSCVQVIIVWHSFTIVGTLQSDILLSLYSSRVGRLDTQVNFGQKAERVERCLSLDASAKIEVLCPFQFCCRSQGRN